MAAHGKETAFLAQHVERRLVGALVLTANNMDRAFDAYFERQPQCIAAAAGLALGTGAARNLGRASVNQACQDRTEQNAQRKLIVGSVVLGFIYEFRNL